MSDNIRRRSKRRPDTTIWSRSADQHVIRVELTADPLNGKRRRLSRTVRGTKAAAKKVAREMMNERDHGINMSPDKITLAQYMTTWLDRHYAEGQIGDAVLDRYKGIVRKHDSLVKSLCRSN